LTVDVAWTYALGNTPKDTSDTPEFNSISLNTNVAIDMFFDSLSTNATDSTIAEYEIMVWFAHYGDGAQTIGNASGIVDTKVINTTTLYVFLVSSATEVILTCIATSTTATTQPAKASSSMCTHGSLRRTRRRLPVIFHHSSPH
jgi:phage tail tube protein FII